MEINADQVLNTIFPVVLLWCLKINYNCIFEADNIIDLFLVKLIIS